MEYIKYGGIPELLLSYRIVCRFLLEERWLRQQQVQRQDQTRLQLYQITATLLRPGFQDPCPAPHSPLLKEVFGMYFES